MEEEWKTIDEYPNYKISNYGQVYSKKKRKIMKHQFKEGYHRIELYYPGCGKNGDKKPISRLVYQYFGNSFNLTDEVQIDHRDRDKDNNYIGNLRISNRSQNQDNKTKQSTHKGNKCLSTYKGVTYHKGKQRWQSAIRLRDIENSIYLGQFKNQLNAAYVYDQIAKYFKDGEFYVNLSVRDLILPDEHENREQVITSKIREINNKLNQN